MRRILLVPLALLLMASPAAHAQTAKECSNDLRDLENRINATRKKSKTLSDKQAQSLTVADRWLAVAKKHSTGGDHKSCVSSAKKGLEALAGL